MTVKIKGKSRNTKKIQAPQKITEQQMLQEMYAYIDLCFAIFSDEVKKGELGTSRSQSLHIDLKELSNRTCLSVSTLDRLARHNCSLAVRHGTLRKLGAASGLTFDTNQGTVKFVVVSI